MDSLVDDDEPGRESDFGGGRRVRVAAPPRGVAGKARTPIGCVLCGDAIDGAGQHTVSLAGCRHTAHYECFLTANLVRRVMSCPHCFPEGPIKDDYGDCIYMKDMHLDQFVSENVEKALGMRVNEYKTADIIAHAATLARIDVDESDVEHMRRMITLTSGVPARALRSWLPGFAEKDLVRGMLRAHVRPRDLRRDGADVVMILNAHVTLDEMLHWDYTLKELREIGFDTHSLVALGFRAGHMSQKSLVSAFDVRNVFHMTFEDLLQLEGKFYPRAYGALISYCSIGLDATEHRTLGLPGLVALLPHGLDRAAVLMLASAVTLADLVGLGLTIEMLEKFEMTNAADIAALGAPSPAAAAAVLGCSAARLATPPESSAVPTRTAAVPAPVTSIPKRRGDARTAVARTVPQLSPEHAELMRQLFDEF